MITLFNRINAMLSESRLLLDCVISATEEDVLQKDYDGYMFVARKTAMRLRDIMDGE